MCKPAKPIDKIFDKSYVIVTAHRGYSSNYPQNTLLAFEKALELDVDMVEFDINMTRDRVPVIIHNTTVDATTDGSGPVRSFTLEQLRQLDAGCKFDRGQYAGQRIPTLKELLDLLYPAQYLLLNVEIKDYALETVDASMELIRQYPGLVDRCIFTCFNARVLDYLTDRYRVRTQGFLARHMSQFTQGKSGSYSRMDALCLFDDEITREYCDWVEDMGIVPFGCCPDDEASARHELEEGARLVTCNNPVPALELYTRLGLREHPLKYRE